MSKAIKIVNVLFFMGLLTAVMFWILMLKGLDECSASAVCIIGELENECKCESASFCTLSTWLLKSLSIVIDLVLYAAKNPNITTRDIVMIVTEYARRLSKHFIFIGRH